MSLALGTGVQDEKAYPSHAIWKTDSRCHASVVRTAQSRLDRLDERLHRNRGGHRFPGRRGIRLGGVARLKLLLDTHIWLWVLQNPKQLRKRLLQELRDEANELWLSPISTWEALTLNFKGRIRLHGDLKEWLARATAGTHEAPLTHEIALVARQLPLHQDPADRILAGTAQVLDLTLVTADKRLLGLGTIRTMTNR